ncbi:MAG: ribosome-associated translation inhibitor RaiA [Deltaproteobacteria bacterium]|nr:ribosome-associated translation inhibitor RaiA [Deltaproteobacteria bacterium]
MKCSVTFRHMKPSDPIRAHVEDKIDKVTKLMDGCEANVVLSVEKTNHVAHIELFTAGAHRIRAEARSEDMYGSIDVAVEKLVRQLKRYRDKIRDSHQNGAQLGKELSRRVIRVDKVDDSEDSASEAPEIVEHQTLVAREMSMGDALLQMDLLDADFLVYTDGITHQLNVMYRLPDGQYGLIEAKSPPLPN